MTAKSIVIQYPSFGPQHPPRLEAIIDSCPYEACELIAMEMFARDSDYEWDLIPRNPNTTYRRHTVFDGSSKQGRRSDNALRRAVDAAFDAIKPDVVVINGWGHKESRHSLRWCRANDVNFVVLSDSVFENRRRYWPLEQYKKWLLRGASAGFCAGRPQARYLKKLGVPSSSIFHPGACVVDNDYWTNASIGIRADNANLREKLNLPNRYFFVCSRFLSWKNIPFIVRAYAHYMERVGDAAADLVICGSGPDEELIAETIVKLNLSHRVHLKGFRQVDELPAYYSLASCLIHASSNFECWGLVINEGMACGLPVLVSDAVGSAEDLVKNGVNGFTFDPFNEQELARLMVHVSEDEKVRGAMGARSQNIINGHSLEVGAQSFWASVAAALQP